MRGCAPFTRISIKSSVRIPPPPPQQNVASLMVSAGISTKLLQTALMTLRGRSNCPPGLAPIREPRAILQESWNVNTISSFTDLSILSLPAANAGSVISKICCGIG